MQGKEMIGNLFDEAQFIVFKELLPYWAGFLKSYKPPEDPSKPSCMFTILAIEQLCPWYIMHCDVVDLVYF